MVWYSDIRNQQSRGQRFEPIELQAILAYREFLRMAGVEMTAFDWDMLLRLDAKWRESVPKTEAEIKAEQRASRQTRH